MPRRRRQFGWPPKQHEPALMEGVAAAREMLTSAKNAYAAGDCRLAVTHWAISKEEITKASQHLASFFPRYAISVGKRRLRSPGVGGTILDLMKEAGELQENLMRTCVVHRPPRPDPARAPPLTVIPGGRGMSGYG